MKRRRIHDERAAAAALAGRRRGARSADRTARALVAIAALVVAACDATPMPPPTPPAAAPADAGGAPAHVVSVAIAPADAAVGTLERDLQAIERWEREAVRPPAERLARWRDLDQRATGTEYASFARARIGALGREAQARLTFGDWSYDNACLDCLGGAWDRGLARVDSVATAYPGTAAGDEAARHRDELAQYRDAFARAPLALSIGIAHSAEAWEPPPGGPVRLVAAVDVAMSGTDGKTDWDRLVFHAPGRSRLCYALQVPTLPTRTFLVLRHFSAFAGSQYSPITVSINERVRVGHWNPVRLDRGRYSAWDVTDWLRPGENTLEIRLDADAMSTYWLYGATLSDVSPEPTIALRD